MRSPRLLGITLAVVLASASPALGAVKINKIRYNPPGHDTGENAHRNREYVVLRNGGNRMVTLTGWRLKDAQGHIYRFPPFRLHPGKTVLIHSGRGIDDRDDLYWEQSFVWYIWNNEGDTATLKDDDGRRRDRCHYAGGDTSVIC
jgi:hypothetical protein